MSKTHKVSLMLAMVLALAAPAVGSARADEHGRGGGQGRQAWHGEGRFEPRGGGGQFGRGQPPVRADPRSEGRFDRPEGEYPPAEGRYGRRDIREGPPYYAEPPAPRRPANSLREGWREQQDEAREGVRNGELAPLRDILPSLRQRTPGRMLDTGIEEGPDGRAVYRIRWAAQNGRRMDFIVDARTGAVLGTEGQ